MNFLSKFFATEITIISIYIYYMHHFAGLAWLFIHPLLLLFLFFFFNSSFNLINSDNRKRILHMFGLQTNIIFHCHRAVKRYLPWIQTLTQRRHDKLRWRTIKVGNGKSLLSAVHDHAMKNVWKSGIGDKVEEISHVNKKCTGEWRNRKPSDSIPGNLEAIYCLALVEDGQEEGVGMGG